ncbi:hypothetical protein BKA62DRAFT_807087 [Auriculariales sp. MPI-PUGE-AT-0066]|nr:hypothetical protein BKA62DRAFT_807087 [Auriculariales sp. MPI-PUGE-AT-0066]
MIYLSNLLDDHSSHITGLVFHSVEPDAVIALLSNSYSVSSWPALRYLHCTAGDTIRDPEYTEMDLVPFFSHHYNPYFDAPALEVLELEQTIYGWWHMPPDHQGRLLRLTTLSVSVDDCLTFQDIFITCPNLQRITADVSLCKLTSGTSSVKPQELAAVTPRSLQRCIFNEVRDSVQLFLLEWVVALSFTLPDLTTTRTHSDRTDPRLASRVMFHNFWSAIELSVVIREHCVGDNDDEKSAVTVTVTETVGQAVALYDPTLRSRTLTTFTPDPDRSIASDLPALWEFVSPSAVTDLRIEIRRIDTISEWPTMEQEVLPRVRRLVLAICPEIEVDELRLSISSGLENWRRRLPNVGEVLVCGDHISSPWSDKFSSWDELYATYQFV